jgi:hypothetical protein
LNKILTIGFLSIAFLSSCKRTRPCSNAYITPVFVGFEISDLDTIIVREYNKGDNFQQILDTALIPYDPNVLSFYTSNDTTTVNLNFISGEAKYIVPDYDWQIYIPAQNLTISISNIISQTVFSCFKCGCLNPINSFVQNGQVTIPQVKPIPNFGSGYVTYIQR